MTRLLTLLALSIQIVLSLRVLVRLTRSRFRQRPLRFPANDSDESHRTSIIVPVLNEETRIGSCLAALCACPENVPEILIVDGGSTDTTKEIVHTYAEYDSRISLLDACPVPSDWNGKAWGLDIGYRKMGDASSWVCTVDADTLLSPTAVTVMLHTARSYSLSSLSLGTNQLVEGPVLSMMHPSLLTSLVYRFGIPGTIACHIDDVQANGQCALYSPSALRTVDGFSLVKNSLCEDVTLARELFVRGERVGFFESAGLAKVRMYRNARDCLANWPRSLATRDRFYRARAWVGLLEISFVQAVPILVSLISPFMDGSSIFIKLNRLLLTVRLGVLLGTRRAYECVDRTYWLSPLADVISVASLALSLSRKQHAWRGRMMVTESR